MTKKPVFDASHSWQPACQSVQSSQNLCFLEGKLSASDERTLHKYWLTASRTRSDQEKRD